MESSADNPIVPGLPAAVATPASDYKDRSTALVVFGVVEILGGALAALFVPFSVLAILMVRKSGGETQPGGLLSPVITYTCLAAVLIVLGIGAVMARRWARALNLIVAWVWVIMGTFVTGIVVFLMPSAFLASLRTAAERNPSANVSTGAMAVILTIFIVIAGIFLIFLPLVFLAFYSSRNVAETCRHRDPVERWTDRRPLPVIAVALITATSVVYYMTASITIPMFPFFGRYLTGAAAVVPLLIFALIDVYIVIAFLRLKVAGWWVAVAALTIRMVSSVTTLGRANLMEAYSHAGWSSSQLSGMQANPMLRSPVLLWSSVGFMAVYLGFLIWLKRYFRPATGPSYTGGGAASLKPATPES